MENPLNYISRANDAVTDAVSVISSKKEKITKTLINTVLLFIILLVFGCLDFAKLKFNFELLATASYWGTVFTKVVAGVCAFNLGTNIMWDTEIKKDKILADAIIRYNHLKKYKQMDFDYFCTRVLNPKLKKEAYINSINRKIYLLNKFTSAKNRLLYSTEAPKDATKEYIKELAEKKAKNKYCVKRQELEDLKSEEYIAKNLNNIQVRYNEVEPSIFNLEIDGAEPKVGIKTKGNVSLERTKASSTVVAGMIGFAMFIASFTLELDKQQFASQMEAFWHYCLKCAEDTGIILWQTTKGMMVTRKIISSALTQPYVGRCKVLEKYYRWRVREGVITQEQLEIIIGVSKPGDDEVEIEMTEEEFKRYQEKGK